MSMEEQVKDIFHERFRKAPAFLAMAPGRVNLIGEHTDYNDGFVLPMAIDRAVRIALRPRADRLVVAQALGFQEEAEFNLDEPARDVGWPEYLKGVAHVMQKAGYALRGWEGIVGGDIPIGAGLSSSAALEMAVARAFCEVSGIKWRPAVMARLGQRAENEWVGVRCGIMDQMVSALGKAGQALLLDCRSLEYEHVPLPDGTVVVILDTSTRRGLMDSAYNERREQCETAARALGVAALRDVSMDRLASTKHEIAPVTLRRACHVVSENERTARAAHAMKRGDAELLGRIMNESHESLRNDFEVSSTALDHMVESARSSPGCLGARMTGAGFGGCAVALVLEREKGLFVDTTRAVYKAKTGLEPAIYVCRAVDGAQVVEV